MKNLIICLIIKASLLFSTAAMAAEVNLYTDRQEVFLKPVLQQFTDETGIKVNVLFIKKGLLERIKAEGNQSPADVIMTVDVGRMQDFVNSGLVSPHNDEKLKNILPTGLANDNWVALTRRARILYVRKDADIKSYDDLANPKNRNSVCLRSGLHLYNIALFADMIYRKGRAATKKFLQGIKANLARKPQANDSGQILGVADGKCVVGLANSYYYVKLSKDPAVLQKMEETLDVVIPPELHINMTGAALAANSPNRNNGLALMHFLISKKAQETYAKENGEFPARNDVAFPPIWKDIRTKIINAVPVSDYSTYRAAASSLVEEVGLNR